MIDERTSALVANIARRMTALRRARSLSLQDIADRAQLSKSHVWEMEKGRGANPTIDTAVRVAAALGVSFEYLVGLGGDEPALHPDAMRIACEVDALLRKQRRKAR